MSIGPLDEYPFELPKEPNVERRRLINILDFVGAIGPAGRRAALDCWQERRANPLSTVSGDMLQPVSSDMATK
jgi:hypothetical protein